MSLCLKCALLLLLAYPVYSQNFVESIGGGYNCTMQADENENWWYTTGSRHCHFPNVCWHKNADDSLQLIAETDECIDKTTCTGTCQWHFAWGSIFIVGILILLLGCWNCCCVKNEDDI